MRVRAGLRAELPAVRRRAARRLDVRRANPPRPTPRYALVLVLPPRQREEARALLARAVGAGAPGGIVVACRPNDEGALRRGRPADSLPASRATDASTTAACTGPRRCRARRRTTRCSALEATRRAAARSSTGAFVSRPGVFAWDRIDPASALLAAHLPADLRGRAADLGAGYGYLSTSNCWRRCPRRDRAGPATKPTRARLALARRNLESDAARTSARVPLARRDDGTAAAVRHRSSPTRRSTRSGGAGRKSAGAFIAAAAEALKPGGRLWLVANRHLPYEETLGAEFGTVRTVAQETASR
ncbi:MAG: methyltransferase [Nibricoccus sp.]